MTKDKLKKAATWIPAMEKPIDGDYLTVISYKGELICEIAPWRNGIYQGSMHMAEVLGFAKVLYYMIIPPIPEQIDTIV